MGTMEDIDTRNFGECRGKFLHARIVKIDITKPLRRGIKVAMQWDGPGLDSVTV